MRLSLPAVPLLAAVRASLAGPRRRRVLLVEDSALTARELSDALNELCHVDVKAVVASEELACRVLRQRPEAFDVLVVDMFLASGSGLGVLRALRALGLPLPAYVLSNFTPLEVRRQCIALGAVRVFDKSRQLDAFFHTMTALSANDKSPQVTDAKAA